MLYECTYESTLIRMYVWIYAYTNVRTNLRLYECTYESTLIRMYVRIYAYTNVRTNLRLYECTYESTLIRMYVRVYALYNLLTTPRPTKTKLHRQLSQSRLISLRSASTCWNARRSTTPFVGWDAEVYEASFTSHRAAVCPVNLISSVKHVSKNAWMIMGLQIHVNF